MDRGRGFNFKLLVPPRINGGQVSAIRSQENVGDCSGLKPAVQQDNSKYFDKEPCKPFTKTNLAVTSSPLSQDLPKMKVVPPMEKEGGRENSWRPGETFFKLYEEIEKIRCWKIKAETDNAQRERKLQENKRTIETQRKAIQELQFGIESLSIKLEKEIEENEDLRIKNNATRNLCNILKEIHQQSAAKMEIFVSEREETHHLFMENSENIQKMIAAFESLHTQAEADRHERQKLKDALLQFEDLDEKYQDENKRKEEEVEVLQRKLNNKEKEMLELLPDLHETQKNCKQLEETTNQQNELLKNSRNEQKSLLEKLHTAEQHCKEAETHREATATALEQTKEEYSQIILQKEASLQEMDNIKNQQADDLEKIQKTVQELQSSLTFETQTCKDLEDKLMAKNNELEKKCNILGELMEQSARKDGQIGILQEELDIKSKSTESLLGKIDFFEIRLEELTAELSGKTEEVQHFKNEAEKSFAEKNLLKKTCVEVENALKDLKEKFNITEIKVQDLDVQLSKEMKTNGEYTYQIERLREESLQHKVHYEELLSNFKELLSEKKAIQEQCSESSSRVKDIKADLKMSEESGMKLTREIQRLEEENQCLREDLNSLENKTHEENREIETLQNINSVTEKQVRGVKVKLCNLRAKYEAKVIAKEECQKENKMLKKQLAKEERKSSQLENLIDNAHTSKKQTEEEQHKLLKDLEAKSAIVTELENEVQKLKCSADDARKNKDDTVGKCQQKIADMVALMEKHKSQYDRIVQEKDAELKENKRKETEAVASRKSLEVELSKHKTQTGTLKQQLQIEMTQKENLQKELNDVKKEFSHMKNTQLSKAKNQQSPAFSYKQSIYSKTPKEKTNVFDSIMSSRTPSYSRGEGRTAATKNTETINQFIKTPSRTTPKSKKTYKEDLKSPKGTNKFGTTTKIKSYRIRTPPSSPSRKGVINLDPKSDSSDQTAFLTFANTPEPSVSAPRFFKKSQSPLIHCKSPGNALKLAAMKRMRDAGWTAVTGSFKKKKKTNEKVFA
ncbi:synaptonemal complex protein 1 [Genypterus blacodes]|uniref:synaptonemal complex protein 1 n=1 Tax=Genypterus blacodes TaxID=154954 RepID=UPI003F75E0FB